MFMQVGRVRTRGCAFMGISLQRFSPKTKFCFYTSPGRTPVRSHQRTAAAHLDAHPLAPAAMERTVTKARGPTGHGLCMVVSAVRRR